MNYINYAISFREIPDEISLCINISGCDIQCPDCHSKYLWEHTGNPVTESFLEKIISENIGISCVVIMGGSNFDEIIKTFKFIKNNFEYLEEFRFLTNKFKKIKTGWYTGYTMARLETDNILPMLRTGLLDYLKTGPYIKEYGGLDKKTTNQRMWRINPDGVMTDITDKFWKNFYSKE